MPPPVIRAGPGSSSTWWPASRPSTGTVARPAIWRVTGSSTPSRFADWLRPHRFSSPIRSPVRWKRCAISRRRRWSAPCAAGISRAASPDVAARPLSATLTTPFRSTTRIGQPADGRYWKTSNVFAGNIIGSKRSAGGAIRNWRMARAFVWDTPSLNSRVSGKTAANLYLSGFRPMSKRLQRRSSRTAARLRMVLTAEGIIELTPHRQLDTLSRTLCGRSLLPEVK